MSKAANTANAGSNRAAVLDTVFIAAGAFERAESVCIKAIVDAGGDQEDIKYAFYAGVIAEAHGLSKEASYQELGKSGATSKAADDQRRTPAIELTYGMARQRWARALKRAGLKTDKPKTASAKSAPKVPGAPEAESLTLGDSALIVPRVADIGELSRYMSLMATHLTHLMSANAAKFEGALGMEYRDAIAGFVSIAAHMTAEKAEALHTAQAKKAPRKKAA